MTQSVTVKLFAAARQSAGQDAITLQLQPPVTVRSVRQALVRSEPDLATLVSRAMIAVDADYASDETLVRPEAEVALIPPVSGG